PFAKLVLQGFAKRGVSRTALEKGKGRMALVVRIGIAEQWNADRVEDFDSLHVDASADSRLNIERDEVEIVVGLHRVAIKLDVAFYLQVLAGIDQRPGGRRETHAAHIKIREPRAALIENVI